MNVYERFGRMTEERDIEALAHMNTLKLLRDLKDGKVSFENVTITDNGWRLEPPNDAVCEVTDG